MSRGLCILESEVEAKFLPFESAQLMKRQYVDSLDIPQTGRELGDMRNVLRVVG
jgi:hypothetical protein